MRLSFVFICFAALFAGVTIGLVAKGESVDDAPRLATEIVGGRQDASAASSTATTTTTPAFPQAAQTDPVQVAGLMIHRTLQREGEHGEELAFFGTFHHTRVALELDLAKVADVGSRRIVSLLSDESTVTRFADDRGTDLKGDVDADDLYEMMPRTSKDALGLQTVVGSKTVPHPQATRVVVEGTLAVLAATETKTIASGLGPIEPGATLSLDGYTFEVVKTGPSDWDPDQWSIELKTSDSLRDVVQWSLVDADGTSIDLEESMTWQMNTTTQKTLLAPKKVEEGSLRIEAWADSEVLSIPYATSASVGLH